MNGQNLESRSSILIFIFLHGDILKISVYMYTVAELINIYENPEKSSIFLAGDDKIALKNH